jgi:hypothetical protein
MAQTDMVFRSKGKFCGLFDRGLSLNKGVAGFRARSVTGADLISGWLLVDHLFRGGADGVSRTIGKSRQSAQKVQNTTGSF